MENDKIVWWQSKGIWGALIAMFGGIATMIGHPIRMSEIDANDLADKIIQIVGQLSGLVTLVGGIMAWYGRTTATREISNNVITPPPPESSGG